MLIPSVVLCVKITSSGLQQIIFAIIFLILSNFSATNNSESLESGPRELYEIKK